MYHSPFFLVAVACVVSGCANPGPDLTVSWRNDMLTIAGDELPGGTMEVHYIEAYCRPGSTDRNWNETVIGHKTELVLAQDDGKKLYLQCALNDGVVVRHVITADRGEVSFLISAHNPRDKPSLAHWAQPCIRVDRFTGTMMAPSTEQYLPKSFIFVDGQLQRMPVEPWATQARYTPGQVWCPHGVPRDDVNPRPLSAIVPSHGLIGCFSDDEEMLFATAFEPYQELFQGVICCLHADFRIGGLAPGQTKNIRGKIYIMDNDVGALLRRYRKDFPERH